MVTALQSASDRFWYVARFFGSVQRLSCSMLKKRRLITHTWETPSQGEAVHSWENSDASDGCDPDGSDSDNDPSEDSCRARFCELLEHMYVGGSLSAVNFCIVMWWVSGFDTYDRFQQLGEKPGCPTGHYQRHLDEKLGFKNTRDNMYSTESRCPVIVGTICLEPFTIWQHCRCMSR